MTQKQREGEEAGKKAREEEEARQRDEEEQRKGLEEMGEGMRTIRGLVDRITRSSIPEEVREKDEANYYV